MTERQRRLLPIAVAGLFVVNGLGAAAGLLGDGHEPRLDVPAAVARPEPDAVDRAVEAATGKSSAARRFLEHFVAADGRVVRRDQGGDTVSEGQAYAMLLAVGLGDRAKLDLVWAWTTAHLGRPDGMLSWRWEDGAVTDAEAAADADLAAAWALALAARRWPDGGYDDAARELAAAVAMHETYAVGDRAVLAAGPWAVADAREGEPLVVNPSYAAPVADAVLSVGGMADPAATERRRAGNRAVVEELIDAHGFPTDWAVVDSAGRAGSAPRADGQGGPGRFSWDAVRVPLWFAPSCDPADRAVAAATWPAFEAGAGVDAMGDHPARLVGAAAAAAAAGEADRARALLDEAADRTLRTPTYYGTALTAIGQLLLTTGRLDGCPPLAPDPA